MRLFGQSLETVRKAPISFKLEPQKAAKRVNKAPFSLLEFGCKGVPAPLQTLFGQSQKGSSRKPVCSWSSTPIGPA